MEKIIDRVHYYLSYKGISASAYERLIGVSNGYLSVQRKKSADIGEGVIKKILDYSDDLSVEWLIRGKGEMIVGNSGAQDKEIWLLPGHSVEPKVKASEILKDVFKNANAVMRYMGHSMKEYPQGSLLFLEKIDTKHEFSYGEVCVVETVDFRLVRRLAKGRDGFVRAFASNEEMFVDKTLMYPPIEISIEEIKSLYLVIGYVLETSNQI